MFGLLRKRLAIAAALALPLSMAAIALGAPSVSAATQTVVTIQFDDGNADQFQTVAVLSAHGMTATYYVNSGVIDDAVHLSWAQLTNMAAAGDEIAGHTIDHANLKHLKTAAATHEVCDDRVALFNHGFQPVSFAYPFGSFDSGTKAIVAACGYNSGRGVSGVDDKKTFAETIPPADAYATRTPANVKSGTTLATVESYVTAAEQHGGGWVQIVIHHICDHCDAYSMTAGDFAALLDWLAPRAASGTVVLTTAQVVGGPVQPPVPGS